jgi:hypothetical protein
MLSRADPDLTWASFLPNVSSCPTKVGCPLAASVPGLSTLLDYGGLAPGIRRGGPGSGTRGTL